MKNNIGYVGWIGNRNIGDEAIYLANKKLFPEYRLIEDEYTVDSNITLFGGGTILPHALFDTSSYSVTSRERNIGLGVGVRQEKFDNRTRGNVDLSSFKSRLRQTGVYKYKPVRYAISLIEKGINDFTPYEARSHFHFRPEDYRSIEDFGFDTLTVRGPDSKQQLSKYDIEAKISGDPALILEPDEYDYQRRKKIIVCLRGRTRYSWTNDISYVDEIVSFLNDCAKEYDVSFVPFEVVDIPINYDASRRVEGASFEDFVTYLNIQKTIKLLNESDLVIGEKLHANILAACCYTPFISIEYMPKHTDFLKSIGMTKLNIRNDELSKDSLEDIFMRATHEQVTSDLHKEVEKKRETLRNYASAMVNDI